jgi:hypothetical protein
LTLHVFVGTTLILLFIPSDLVVLIGRIKTFKTFEKHILDYKVDYYNDEEYYEDKTVSIEIKLCIKKIIC